MRVALYWAPAVQDVLHELGSAWLGRDAETGAQVALRDGVPEDAVSGPAVYGFHATLRPPMRLATGWGEFMEAAEHVARSVAPFEMTPLRVADMDGALALVEEVPCPAMRMLADACVEHTDRHRLAPGDAELARRRQASLSPVQETLLQRWGYPYVMEAWQFHVTLTRRLDDRERAVVRQAAEAHFGAVLRAARPVQELCVFTQAEAGAPFLIAERLPLTGPIRRP